MICPSCGEPVAATDAFCEACGGDLAATTGAAPARMAADGSTMVGAAAAGPELATAPTDPPGADPAEPPKTVLIQPGAAATLTGPGGFGGPEGPVALGPCLACGGDIDEDGFCTTCGQKARSPRDHWTEAPTSWVGGVCDKGISHERNEDAMALAVTDDRSRAVLVVCDGVTSAPDSDRASIAAARAACRTLAAAPAAGGASVPARLRHWEQHLVLACRDAHGEAVGVARLLGNPPEPPSCTFVAAVVDVDLACVAWCGDSRAYWLPDAGPGRQLGVDHSVGAALIAQGTPVEVAERDPGFHTITRWLGADSIDPTPEFVAQELDEPGWVLVCSDGMWNYASSPSALAELLAEAQRAGATSPVTIAESLAAWANDRGGHDNVSVALARCERRVP